MHNIYITNNIEFKVNTPNSVLVELSIMESVNYSWISQGSVRRTGMFVLTNRILKFSNTISLFFHSILGSIEFPIYLTYYFELILHVEHCRREPFEVCENFVKLIGDSLIGEMSLIL